MKPLFLTTVVILCLLLSGCSRELPPTQPPETIPQAAEATLPSTEPAEETTVPEPTEYVLSFVGDCCLANQKGWSEKEYFLGTVGENYAYPFAGVAEYLSADDFTFINLENPLTDGNTPMNKPFVFKGPAAYTQILTEGSIEYANVVNNHAMDYREEGYRDTLSALDSAEIAYCEQGESMLFTTDRGLVIGVHAQMFPANSDSICQAVTQLREGGAEIVIVSLHWGKEYYYKPMQEQVDMAHAIIDAGADILYGHHSHVLQNMEAYHGGMIFYSLGNFCFGGNSNPEDKDTAIMQQRIIREPDGSIRMGNLDIIPCSLSSIDRYNDFQPTPLELGTEDYDRVLSKLDGSFGRMKVTVSNRPELG